MIVKSKGGYKVRSHTSGRSFGTYKSRAGAERRLKQIRYFKYRKGRR